MEAIKAVRLRIKRISPFVLVHTDWLSKAAVLPGRTMNYALALLVTASRTGNATVRPSRYVLERYQISRDVAGDALTRLEAAGLVKAERQQGRRPRITLVDGAGQTHQLTQ